MSTPRHTPIRRISRGSFSEGTARAHSETPLSFLCEEALPILSEETTTLQDNMEQLRDMHAALSTFNESFAMFLYGLRMNAFCVEWPEAPGEELAGATLPAPEPPAPQEEAGDASYMTDTDDPAPVPANAGVRARVSASVGPRARANVGARAGSRAPQSQTRPQPAASQPATSRAATRPAQAPGRQARIPVGIRKQREALADAIIQTMPLEYRGDNSVRIY